MNMDKISSLVKTKISQPISYLNNFINGDIESKLNGVNEKSVNPEKFLNKTNGKDSKRDILIQIHQSAPEIKSLRTELKKNAQFTDRSPKKEITGEQIDIQSVDQALDESIYARRKNHVNFICMKFDLRTSLKDGGHGSGAMKANPLDTGTRMSVDPLNKVAWIRVAKAGTESWKTIFKNLTKGQHVSFHYHGKPEDKPDYLREKGFRTFMFSRHPFTRLLSAYRGKLENKNRNKAASLFYRKFGWKIVEKYRSEKDKKRIKSAEPTFKEFVNYVLFDNQKNKHWRPVYWLTFPCAYNYTVLGKLETFSDDTNYIIKKFNLKGVALVWENRHEGGDVQIYYKQINEQELKALYHFYALDFLVFNYSYQPYPSYLGKSTLEYQYDVK